MLLSKDQSDLYSEQGYLFFDSLFSQEEVRQLHSAFERDCADPGPHRILEKDSDQVRALYASHLRRPEFAALIRSPRLLAPARQILSAGVYVYQFKINTKPAFGGAEWAWHQDFLAWRLMDNLGSPLLVNVGVFLDDVTEFNGPLIVLPGSHRCGMVRDGRNAETASEEHLDPDDISLPPAQVAELVERHGMTSLKGAAGSVVFFHPELVHGSGTNMSPLPRKILIATYNDAANPPRPLGDPRPEFLVCRDITPLEPADLVYPVNTRSAYEDGGR